MERKKTNSKKVTNEVTLRSVLYIMHEEAHLTLKEKKKKKDEKRGWEGGRVGGWEGGKVEGSEDRSCAPAYETFVLTVKRQRRSPIRKRDI